MATLDQVGAPHKLGKKYDSIKLSHGRVQLAAGSKKAKFIAIIEHGQSINSPHLSEHNQLILCALQYFEALRALSHGAVLNQLGPLSIIEIRPRRSLAFLQMRVYYLINNDGWKFFYI
jgi:hypothetical protein